MGHVAFFSPNKTWVIFRLEKMASGVVLLAVHKKQV
jgi:hypothetical protein